MDSILDEVLNSEVGSKAAANALGVVKSRYRELVAYGNVTSFSMQEDWHRCRRRFQIKKLQADNNSNAEQETNVDFAFGHAVGAGIATYDETKDLDKAIFSAFLAWNMDLLEEKEWKASRNPKKSFHHAVWALMAYEVFYQEETDLADYEVVKTEAALAVDFENGYFYVGHVDEILRHKETGQLKIKENKTTGFATVDPAIYSNKEQALSYSIVADQLGASEYEVLYTVYSTPEQRWMLMPFTKTNLAKAEWLQGQLFIAQEIEASAEINFFPKNGDGCVKWNRRCEFYESCDFDSVKVFGKRYEGLKKCQSLEELDEIEKFDYKFTWTEIVERQKKRVSGEVGEAS